MERKIKRMSMKQYEFWFVVGSQFLYGPEVLETVARRAAEMADWMNQSGKLPCKVVYKVTAKTQQEIADALGIPKWEVKTSLWPEAKAEARRIYRFINYRSR